MWYLRTEMLYTCIKNNEKQFTPANTASSARRRLCAGQFQPFWSLALFSAFAIGPFAICRCVFVVAGPISIKRYSPLFSRDIVYLKLANFDTL